MSKRRKQEQRAVAERERAAAQQQRQLTRQQITASFSGPLPPPGMLDQYNNVIPNGAERIMALVEKQSDHRIAQEARVIDADIRRANWGVVAGVFVCLASFGTALTLVSWGHEISGTIIGGGGIASLAGVFVYGTQARRMEREQRHKRNIGER